MGRNENRNAGGDGHNEPFELLEREVEFHAIRAQGAGGQNVNKVSNAVQLRFDIRASSLPEGIKSRLLAWHDQRINRAGVVVIKAQQQRSLEQNRALALDRLTALITAASYVPRTRVPTRPSRAARQRRIDAKVARGQTKALRGRVFES